MGICMLMSTFEREREYTKENAREGILPQLGSSIPDIHHLHLKPECGVFEYNRGECTFVRCLVLVFMLVSLIQS